MATRAAQEIDPGSTVNLGIGIPLLIPDLLADPQDVWLQSENGILGMGPFPTQSQVDPQTINAGKQTVTIRPGGSCFDSVTSFTMIRGGHMDLAILGAMQVSAHGDLANWAIPNGKIMGIGGAMDLAVGARRLIVVMTHVTKEGQPKLVANCNYPLTASGVVDRIITDWGVFDVDSKEGQFRLLELAPEISEAQVREATLGKLV